MDNKIKKIIYDIAEALLVMCIFGPIIYSQIYLRKTSHRFKYRTLIFISTVVLCLFLVWAISKLLGIDAFFRKNAPKQTWVNFALLFVRCGAISFANSFADSSALSARVNMVDKSQAIQEIHALWIGAIIIIIVSSVVEKRYNKKREIQNEN